MSRFRRKSRSHYRSKASGNRSRHGETLAGRRACVVGCDIKDSMPVEHERAVYVKEI